MAELSNEVIRDRYAEEPEGAPSPAAALLPMLFVVILLLCGGLAMIEWALYVSNSSGLPPTLPPTVTPFW